MTIHLSGQVGRDITHQDLAWKLADQERPRIRLASAGGDTASASVIYQQIRAKPAEVAADFAGSAAVMILLAGERRTLAADGWIMLHSAWTHVTGGVAELRAAADEMERTNDFLDATIAERTGLTLAEVRDLYTEGDRYLSPAEALELGFIHEIEAHTGKAKPAPENTPHRKELMRLAGLMRATEWIMRPPEVIEQNKSAIVAAIDTNPAYADLISTDTTTPSAGLRLPLALMQALDDQRKRVADSRKGKPLPAEPWTGRWRCTDCDQMNFRPIIHKGLPAPCSFCGNRQEETT